MSEEDLIAKYKLELQSEAELARSDLDEIEDHLRALASELRDRGMPRVEAVAEACRRLGDPREVAREHARVRSPFGARLSKLRAYSAVALMLPLLGLAAVRTFPTSGVLSSFGMQVVLGAFVTLGLALRFAWARPIALGGAACFAVLIGHGILTSGMTNPAWLLPYLGIIAFVAPWRRGELGAPGWALVLSTWAFGVATFGMMWQLSTPDGHRFIAPAAAIAFLTTVIATVGTMLRARWGAAAALLSTLALTATVFEYVPWSFAYMNAASHVALFAILASGVVAAALGTILSWRGARSTLGTLQHVLR